MDTGKDYYDLLGFELENVKTLEDIFYVKDLKQRKLHINYDIDQYGIADAVKHILQFNREDINAGIPPEERKPIILYVVSNGGEIDSGFELIDTIQCSETPVYTVNLGFQYSMGFLIGLAGHKRFAMPNAKFLMHDGTSFVYGTSSKVRDQMAFNERAENRIKDFILSHSKLSEQEYDEKLRVEWYLFADEAKEKGFTDYIIGTDCSVSEVI